MLNLSDSRSLIALDKQSKSEYGGKLVSAIITLLARKLQKILILVKINTFIVKSLVLKVLRINTLAVA